MGRNEKRTLANLPSGERILVDSNILPYHLLDYPTYGQMCEKFLQDILDEKHRGFITPIIDSETLFNFIKANILATHGVKIRDVVTLLKRDPEILKEISLERPKELFGIFDILPIGAMETEEFIDYVSRYALLTNDALNAAAIKVNKITSIVTNDKDFMRVADMTIWGILQQIWFHSNAGSLSHHKGTKTQRTNEGCNRSSLSPGVKVVFVSLW